MTPAPAIITCLGGGCESFKEDMASLKEDCFAVVLDGVVKATTGAIKDIQTKKRDEKTVANT